jgi:plastocyanin
MSTARSGRKAGALALTSLLALGLVPAPAEATTFDIAVINFAFDPDDITIDVGDTVRWTNDPVLSDREHTVTDARCAEAGGAGPCEFDNCGEDGRFGGGCLNFANAILPGDSTSHTFNTAGVFEFVCTIHFFVGTINVGGVATQPDLRVTSITSITSTTAPNLKTIFVTVQNQGTAGAPGTRVLIQYEYQGSRFSISQPLTSSIAAGNSATVAATWNTLGKLGDFTIHATADSLNTAAESDESNNAASAVVTVTLPVSGVAGTDLLDPL